MIKDMTLGQYVPGSSIIHRMDPRNKIILVVLLMTLIFFVDTFADYALMGLLAASLIMFSGIPAGYYLRSIKPLLFIILFTAFFSIFFSENIMDGVINSLEIATRIVILVIIASALILTTSPISVNHAVENILMPLTKIGFPAHEFSMMVTMAIRFIPVLLEETERIIKAQTSKGAQFDTGGLIERAKSFTPILVPLFIGAFRRAEEIAIAMEARCYRGGKGRTSMRKLKVGIVDAYAIAYVTVFVVGIIML